MHFSIATFLAALALSSATLGSANPTTTTRSTTGLNPPLSVTHPIVNVAARAAAPQPGEYMTNAKRLAAGLPLNKPHRRSLKKRAHAAPAKRSGAPPVSVGGIILVTNLDTASVLGYISPTFNDFGQYGNLVSSPTDALKISFSYDALAPTQISITAINSADSAAPFFGGIVGYASSSDDIGTGNPNYQCLGGTVQTTAGAPPADVGTSFEDATDIDEDAESAIWNYDLVTQALTPQWINTDGSAPATSILYVSEEPLFALTGDSAEFKNLYGLGADVSFTFLPSA